MGAIAPHSAHCAAPGIEHIRGKTYHARRGATQNAFQYSVDYILLDAEEDFSKPGLFARNGRGLMSLQDRDHGGSRMRGAVRLGCERFWRPIILTCRGA